MADPITIGTLAASALAMGGEAVLKSGVGEVVKDAYKALKDKLSHWGRSDVEALEKNPSSSARQAVLAELVDGQPADDRAVVSALARQLIAALKRAGTVGLEVRRLDALEVQLGAITVTEGTGVRIDEARVSGTFRTGDITVGDHLPKKH